MNSSALSAFVRKSAAVATIAGIVALGSPFVALANPTVTVTLSSTAPASPASTSQNPIPVTATFSEGVTGFNASDITVSNGLVTNFATVSTSVYTFGIVPTAPGSTTVSIAATTSVISIADHAHTNQASNPLEFVSVAAPVQAGLNLGNFSSGISFSGAPGTTFDAIGSNFAASETVNVGFGGATSTIAAAADGTFTAGITVPSLPVGNAQVTAIGATSGLVATNVFFVEPASTGTTPTPTTTAITTTTGPNAPVITMTSGPANGSSVGSTTVTFAFTVNDPSATVTCTLGGTFACGSPQTYVLGDSAYVFSVTAASSTGISTSTVNFTVDTVAPVIASTTEVVTPNDGTAATYTFTSSEAGTVNLTGGCATAGSASVGTTTITFNTLASGTYNCTLSVSDAAGNISNIIALAPFTVNAPAPTPVPVVSSGGGGGGGGGGVISGPLSIGYVNNTQTQGAVPVVSQGSGQVLGVSTYNFSRPLNIGSRGGDVTQLQTILIADGFLMIANPTGYFGPLTFAAVKLYQQAHGLPQVGNVGPLTRAMLNKGQ